MHVSSCDHDCSCKVKWLEANMDTSHSNNWYLIAHLPLCDCDHLCMKIRSYLISRGTCANNPNLIGNQDWRWRLIMNIKHVVMIFKTLDDEIWHDKGPRWHGSTWWWHLGLYATWEVTCHAMLASCYVNIKIRKFILKKQV